MDVEKLTGSEAQVTLSSEEIGAIILALHAVAPEQQELATVFEALPARMESAARAIEAQKAKTQSHIEWWRERAERQRRLRERSLRNLPPAPPPAIFR